MKKLLISTLVFLAAFPMAALRADESKPTLQETIAYISDKLAHLPPASLRTANAERLEIDGAKVEWFNGGILCITVHQRRWENLQSPPVSLERHYQLPLASLSVDVPLTESPAVHSKKAFGIVLSGAQSTTPAQGPIFVQDGNGMMRSRNKITLWFRDEDTATRLASAFRRAIELSGGKKELFGK